MAKTPSTDHRLFSHELLARARPEVLTEILSGVLEPNRLLAAVLKHSMYLVYARWGMVFTADGVVSSLGYEARHQDELHRHLKALLLEGGTHWYSAPRFNLGHASCLERGAGVDYWTGQPAPGRRVLGMAGVIPGRFGLLAVLAVEREAPFSHADQLRFTEWLELAAIPAGAAAENVRAERMRSRRKKFRLSDLPLDQLEEINLAEIERMLIAEAMRRAGGRKTEAAPLLGLSREGLRKKILRLA